MAELQRADSIWLTTKRFIADQSDAAGDDPKSVQQVIAEYIVGEPLEQVGIIEAGYSFTGRVGNEPIPDAFSIVDDGRELSIILLAGRLGCKSLQRVEAAELKSSIRQVVATIEALAKGESSPSEAGREGVGEFVYTVTNSISGIRLVSFVVVALGTTDSEALDSGEAWLPPLRVPNCSAIPVRITVIDVPTLQQSWHMSSTSGTVNLNFSEFPGGPVPCLRTRSKSDAFETLLAVISGDGLAAIYHRWGSRVLQKNLRNFLQATGKVNKGIQKTLKEQPARFLAYNNGLTVTASEPEFDDQGRILALRDFQIVNGGQTTASLDYAKRFLGVDLSSVSVQAKIIITDSTAAPGFVDAVSNFANSQNKVKLSDFQARDNFQSGLARLMRENEDLAWESEHGGLIFWYYEAFRGGYSTDKHQKSGKGRGRFERSFPRDMVIDKLELAKVENCWDGYPHFVCRGADKNFFEWMRRTKPQSRPEPDNDFCMQLVAKVRIFRETVARVKSAGYAGFKSQRAAYSFSLLCFTLKQQRVEIDLKAIWQGGQFPESLGGLLDTLIMYVGDFLETVMDGEDTSEWVKRETAWISMTKTLDAKLAKSIVATLKKARLLRPATFNIHVSCDRAVQSLKAAEQPLGKAALVEAMLIDDSHWGEVRQALLENYGVEQVESRRKAAYKISEL